MTDLVIAGGTIINPSHETAYTSGPGTLVVENGWIAAVLAPADRPSATRVLDAAGMLVLPGGIDPHVHCRAPSFPQRGDFATESMAAAAGGITTIFEMPISKPGVATTAALQARGALVERDAYVNIALYGAPGLLDAGEVQGMADAGAIAFKLFMTAAPPGREDEFAGLIAPDAASLCTALELTRETGLRCAIHCEDQSLIDLYAARALAHPGPDWQRHLMSRPAVAETVAIASVIQLAQALEAPVHIVHVSAQASIALVHAARQRGVPLTAETCPHYLLFTNDVLAEAGPYAKINPPIRTHADQEALWDAVQAGVLDFIATDHAPFTVAEKEAARGRILEAPPGHPGLEVLVPFLMTRALQGSLSCERAVELMSANAARAFGLYPRKGVLRPGADADICLYDPRGKACRTRAGWLSKGAQANRLYQDLHIQGSVHATIAGGRIICQEGTIVGQRGDGTWLRPHMADSPEP